MRQANSNTTTETSPTFDDTMRLLLTGTEVTRRPETAETPAPTAKDHTEEDGTDWCAVWAHYSEMLD